MNLCGRKRNRKPIGFYNVVSARNQRPFGIVQLPGKLHQSGPVVTVGQRSFPIAGQARGLGIVDQKHPSETTG